MAYKTKKLKHWRLSKSSKHLKEYVVPSKKGIFIGGNEYAKDVILIQRRGNSQKWDVNAIDSKANFIIIKENISKSQSVKVANEYMKKHNKK
jgi:hypothetical protein